MKSLTSKIWFSVFIILLLGSNVQAQGLIRFVNSITSATKISTNSVSGGAATGLTAATAGQFIYALFYSQSAYDVLGQTSPIVGNANNNFAFNDSRWKFAGYATNTAAAGRLSGQTQSDGTTVIPGVAGGGYVQVVVVGWSSSIGTTLSAVTNWFNNGFPVSSGLIGQSAVSTTTYLGDGAAIPPTSVFGTGSGQVSGFVLGVTSGILYSPAYIAAQPTNQTVAAGSTASFSVLAYGDASLPLNCQWRLNGTNISTGGSYSTNIIDYNFLGDHHATFTLTVSNAQLANAGNYSAFASNTAGSMVSSNATLTVTVIAGTPPTITAQPFAQSVGAGSNATFTVGATGTAPLAYQWTFNGTNIANATGASFTLTNVQPASAGNYAVTITNSYGATNSVPVTLSVLTFPPVILAPPASASVPVGNGVTFTVSAGGSTPLSYQWKFNGTNLSGATGASYSIASAQTNQSGTYSVTITNGYGATNATATLVVYPPSGYVLFNNSPNSATKIFTNSDVGGLPTGWTTSGGKYFYALFASATATNVSGQTIATLGNNGNYAFNDPAWTFVAYGTNTFLAGRLKSSAPDIYGQTPVAGFAGGSTVQLVVVGWSANIGPDIASVQSWYGAGNPAFDGWIGESAVSGAITLGDGGVIPAMAAFGAYAPQLQGFTLGLVQPVHSAFRYAVSAPPSPVLSAAQVGNSILLSWSSSVAYVVQSASNPAGPWSDISLSIAVNGSNFSALVPATNAGQFYRLIVQ